VSRYQRAGVLHSEPPLHPGFREVSRLRNAAQQRSERGRAEQMSMAARPGKAGTGRRREADAACQSRPRLVWADAGRQTRTADQPPGDVCADVNGPHQDDQPEHEVTAG
jgi:hypothetical protein